MVPMETPCNDICRLDVFDRCVGCERTSAEIAAWTMLGTHKRSEVMADLPRRREERLAENR